MSSKFRGVKWNNARFPSTIKIRRSIDLAELGDFGSITENSSDLPTAGATHRKETGGSTSATRGHTDLRTIHGEAVVDNQDLGLISDATTTHRVWSAMGAITDIVTEAPASLDNPAMDEGHLFTFVSASIRTFTVPSGVTSISAVAVGAGGGGGRGSTTLDQYGQSGGGGGGGALAYANDIEVSPGDVLYIEIGKGGARGGYDNGGGGLIGENGGNTVLKKITGVDINGNNVYEEMLVAGGGVGGTTPWSHQQSTGVGGQPSGTELDGGGTGGTGGGRSFWTNNGGGGGGAGGYTGNGGDGKHWGGNSTAGTGGAGGGGFALENSTGLGGGVDLYGEGSSGAAGTSSSVHGGSGSGLSEFTGGTQVFNDVQYQYGAGGFGTARKNTHNSMGGDGALRIIWGGGNRAFPSTNVGLSSNDESVN